MVGFQPSASAPSSGLSVARSFSPRITFCPAQYGHPLPAMRLEVVADHICPFLHSQATRLFANLKLLLGSQSTASLARSGYKVAKSFSPETTFLPEQTGQLSPRRVRLDIADFQTWAEA